MPSKAFLILYEQLKGGLDSETESLLRSLLLGEKGQANNEKPRMSKDERELLLFEYQRAQEMLVHSDSLQWTIGTVLIAGTLVFTGLALNKDALEALSKGWRSLVIVLGVPLVSFITLRIWLQWCTRHRAFYLFRYQTLHRIEFKLGFYHFLRALEASEILNIFEEVKDEVSVDKNVKTVVTIEHLVSILESARNRGDQKAVAQEKYKRLTDNKLLTMDGGKLKFTDAWDIKTKKALKESLKDDYCFNKLVKEIIDNFDDLERLYVAKVSVQFGDSAHEFKPLEKVEYSGPSGFKLAWRLVFSIPLLQFSLLYILWSVSMYERANDYLKDNPWNKMYNFDQCWFGLSVVVIPLLAICLLGYFYRDRPDL